MEKLLFEMDYKNVLYHFTELAKIPHGSGNMKPIADYMENFAKTNGISYVRDKYNNIIMKKPAAKGYETAPTVMIQGHMDMVCEKLAEKTHNFLTEPLTLVLDGTLLHADKTTLGGDDGIAVAYGMSLLTDDTIPHPALEIVFTTDEETGMYGAIGLNTKELKSSYLINIDSEDEAKALVSCAGGLTMVSRVPVKKYLHAGIPFIIETAGLLGGHSGTEIHKNRVNGVKLLARFLLEMQDSNIPIFVSSFCGGSKDNAIPREASLLVVIPRGKEEVFTKQAQLHIAEYQNENKTTEPDMNIRIQKGEYGEYEVFEEADFHNLLSVILHAPNGVQRMSADIDGLVESSVNLGILHDLQDGFAEIHFSVRSSVNEYKRFLSKQITELVEAFGGKSVVAAKYPAWEYKKKSKLREIYSSVYRSFYEREPSFEAIHAGLECGILSGKMPELDMISIGPDLRDIHTPAECVEIGSVIRLYRFLERLLAEIKE